MGLVRSEIVGITQHGWRYRFAAFVLIIACWLAASAGPAQASLGYEPDLAQPSITSAGEELPYGIAIDQATQRIYLAVVSSNLNSASGQVQQLESNGVPTAASPFPTEALNPLLPGVAVNPVTGGIYVAQVRLTIPVGTFGEARMRQFASSGAQGTSFPLGNTTTNTIMQIATDSTGRVFYPNNDTDTVQVFDSTGALQASVGCGACPGGAFTRPVGAAVDSLNNLYVVDLGTDRVVKFTPSGASYTYASVLQSGRHAGSVGVDPSTNDVFVGDLPASGYHIVAYNSLGVQFDDFGAGLVSGSTTTIFGIPGAGQIAANATNHKLYVTAATAHKVLIFNRVTINPPTITSAPASSVGQVTGKINGTVNAKGHAVIDCNFQYTDDTDFQANAYANALQKPCPSLPDGTANTALQGSLTGLSPNTTYHYRLVAANNGGSTIGSDATFKTMPLAAPTVTTGSALNLVAAGATLTGTVNPHGGLVSECYLEYGTTVTYGTKVNCIPVPGPEASDVAVQQPITKLSPNTAYHHRLVVTTNAGTVKGSDVEFKTPALVPPSVTTSSASDVTQTTATFTGSVKANGSPTNCHFDYGTSTAYGLSAPCPIDPVGAASEALEQLSLTGLTPATTYHYRLVGTSAAGTTNGDDVSFTTQTETQTVLPPPPPPIVTPTPKPLRCKKGFKKKRVRGKLKCVKKKKARKRKRR